MAKHVEKWLRGIVTPAITPIKNNKIDGRAISALISFLSKSGVSGVFPVGSTGAFPFLNETTHMSVIKEFHKHMDGKMAFLPGTGRNSIVETVRLSNAALKLGADAVVVVTPYYLKLDQRALFAYFDKVARQVKGSIILYNIPQLTGNAMEGATVKALVIKHDNIIGVKESSGDMKIFASVMHAVSGRVAVLQGQDNLLLRSLELGATGGVCGTTNFTGLAVSVYNAYAKGDARTARKMQDALTQVMKEANVLKFPSNYNYLFYRSVMGRRTTNCAEPLPSVSSKDGNKAYGKIRRLIGVGAR